MRTNKKFLLVFMADLALLLCAMLITTAISNYIFDDVESKLESNQVLSNNLSLEVDGSNLTLSGPASLEGKALGLVEGTRLVGDVEYIESRELSSSNPIESVLSESDLVDNLNDIFGEEIRVNSDFQFSQDSKRYLVDASEVIKRSELNKPLLITVYHDADSDLVTNSDYKSAEEFGQVHSENISSFLVNRGVDPNKLKTRGIVNSVSSDQVNKSDGEFSNVKIKWEINNND